MEYIKNIGLKSYQLYCLTYILNIRWYMWAPLGGLEIFTGSMVGSTGFLSDSFKLLARQDFFFYKGHLNILWEFGRVTALNKHFKINILTLTAYGATVCQFIKKCVLYKKIALPFIFTLGTYVTHQGVGLRQLPSRGIFWHILQISLFHEVPGDQNQPKMTLHSKCHRTVPRWVTKVPKVPL